MKALFILLFTLLSFIGLAQSKPAFHAPLLAESTAKPIKKEGIVTSPSLSKYAGYWEALHHRQQLHLPVFCKIEKELGRVLNEQKLLFVKVKLGND